MKQANNNARLISGPVGPALLRMTLSMLIGFIAGAAFNITDTYFVSRLGTEQLAAMGYTFPIVGIVHSLLMGIGMGVVSVISRTIGEGDQDKVRRLTMHSLMLGLVLTFLLIGVGYIFLKQIIVMLGAEPAVLPLSLSYMRIWLAGMLFLVIPVLGNNAIRATGDTLTPSIIMTADLGLNIVLDPIFIFGFGPVPAMGIRGAAIATVLSRSLALFASLYILHRCKRMLSFTHLQLRRIFDSWKRIGYIGLPASATNMLMPVALGIITHIISGYGTAGVAAMTAGMRIEHALVIPIIALGASMIPFIGQNLGAGQYDRIKKVLRIGYLWCLIWGTFCVLFLTLGKEMLAPLFTNDALVIPLLYQYLLLISPAIGFRGISMVSMQSFNALHRPLDSSANMILRLFALQWPLAVLGGHWLGYTGVLVGILAADVISGALSSSWVVLLVRRLARRHAAATALPVE